MKILFICKYNRFRSRVAEAYFKKINKKIKATSSGIFEGMPVPKETIKIAKEFGINIVGKPKPTKEKNIKEQDLIILTADDVPLTLFNKYKNKTIKWKIPDASAKDNKNVKKSINLIINRVNQLNKKLNKK